MYWDVSSVTDMSEMFSSASNFEGEYLLFWDVRKVTDMSGMFKRAYNFSEYINTWIEEKVNSTFIAIDGMYNGCTTLSKWKKKDISF